MNLIERKQIRKAFDRIEIAAHKGLWYAAEDYHAKLVPGQVKKIEKNLQKIKEMLGEERKQNEKVRDLFLDI